jgi:hypothetical protein
VLDRELFGAATVWHERCWSIGGTSGVEQVLYLESCSPTLSVGFGHDPGQALRRRQGGELRRGTCRLSGVGAQEREA